MGPGQGLPVHSSAASWLVQQSGGFLVQRLLRPGAARQVVQQEGEGVGAGVHTCVAVARFNKTGTVKTFQSR